MEQNTSINVTESAQKRIQNLLPEYESNAFRVYVTGGGCSASNMVLSLIQKKLSMMM